MPPHSFCEWVVGYNVNRNKKRPSKRPVVALSVETDDETDTDTVTLAYPRTSSTGGGARQVEQSLEPPKPALKSALTDASAQPESEVSTGYIDYGISDDDSITSSDEEVLPSCPCLRCAVGRRRLRKLKQVKGQNYRPRVTLSSEDEPEDDSRAIHAMHKAMEAQKEMQRNAKAKQYTKNHRRKGSKQKRYIKSDSTDTTELESDSESEADSEDSDTLVSSDDEPTRRKNKQRGRRGSSSKGKKKKREGSRKQRDKSVRDTQMGVDNEDDSERTRQKLVPRYSAPAGKPMPDYIMGPQAHVLHVEHAMESPHDPRPNAFYDNDNGVMRVYHGPAYGNPVGVLYPKLVDNRQQRPLPFGTPHPSYNPWYHGFPPQEGGRQIHPPSGGPPPPRLDASQWFQGWGTTRVGEGAPSSPQKSTIPDVPPVPEFTYDKTKFDQSMRDNLSPEINPYGRQGMDSNVFPSMESMGRPHHHSKSRDDWHQDSTRKTGRPELWGTQSAPEPSGYNSSPWHDDDKRRSKNKKSGNTIDNKPKNTFSAEVDEIIARDKAKIKAMEEKWAKRNGTHWTDGNIDGSADKNAETWDNNIDDDYLKKLNESHGFPIYNDNMGQQNENNGFANDNATWGNTNGNDGVANTDNSWANGNTWNGSNDNWNGNNDNWNDTNGNGNTDNNSGTNGSGKTPFPHYLFFMSLLSFSILLFVFITLTQSILRHVAYLPLNIAVWAGLHNRDID